MKVLGAALTRRWRALGPARWFWLGLATLVVLYVIVLLTAATGAGRGGR